MLVVGLSTSATRLPEESTEACFNIPPRDSLSDSGIPQCQTLAYPYARAAVMATLSSNSKNCRKGKFPEVSSLKSVGLEQA